MQLLAHKHFAFYVIKNHRCCFLRAIAVTAAKKTLGMGKLLWMNFEAFEMYTLVLFRIFFTCFVSSSDFFNSFAFFFFFFFIFLLSRQEVKRKKYVNFKWILNEDLIFLFVSLLLLINIGFWYLQIRLYYINLHFHSLLPLVLNHCIQS